MKFLKKTGNQQAIISGVFILLAAIVSGVFLIVTNYNKEPQIHIDQNLNGDNNT